MILTDLFQFKVKRRMKNPVWVRDYCGVEINISDKYVYLQCDNSLCDTEGGTVWRGRLSNFFDKEFHECKSCRIKGEKNPRGFQGNIAWNKGLTKEDNSIVKRISEKRLALIEREGGIKWLEPYKGKNHPFYGKSVNAGNKNSQYKDGKSYERRANRDCLEIRQWAKRVKERDDFTCQSCGKRGGRLVSHHLYNYATYPDKQLDLENGITLCKGCHDTFHLWNGGPQNSCTKELYEQW